MIGALETAKLIRDAYEEGVANERERQLAEVARLRRFTRLVMDEWVQGRCECDVCRAIRDLVGPHGGVAALLDSEDDE